MNKIKKHLSEGTRNTRKLWIRLCSAVTAATVAMLLPLSVSASNAVQDSTIFKGMMELLNDVGIALLVAAPILGGILIGIFALIQGANQEPHDKEKWAKNKKSVLIVIIWVFGASSLVSITTSYFQ